MGKKEKNQSLREFINKGIEDGSIPSDNGKQDEVAYTEIGESTETDFVFDKEFYDKTQEYNNNIWPVVDSLYADFTPSVGLLVRAKCKNLMRKGIMMPNVEMVGVPTANGIGHVTNIPCPYVFSKEMVIISSPEQFEEAWPLGTVISVITKGRYIIENSAGTYSIGVAGAFTHPEFEGNETPTDPLNKHYGYFIIDPYREAEGVLRKAPDTFE